MKLNEFQRLFNWGWVKLELADSGVNFRIRQKVWSGRPCYVWYSRGVDDFGTVLSMEDQRWKGMQYLDRYYESSF